MYQHFLKYFVVSFAVFGLLFFPSLSLARGEAPRAELQSGAQAPEVVSTDIPEIAAVIPSAQAELAFRVLRVLSVIFSILFINMILAGSFKYMVTSMDDKVLAARKNIIIGSIGTMVFICLYFLATAAILRLEAGV